MDKKEIRKNEILRDSIGVMYLKGYNSTSVNDIAVAADIPKGSFYNYFKDKEHYAVDAVRYYQTELARERIALLSKEELAPLDRITAFFEIGIAQFVGNEYKLGCFAGNLAQEMGDVSDAIAEEIARFYDHIVSLIYANLVEAKDNGELKTEVNLRSLASCIISAWQGSQLRMKVNRNRNVLDDFLRILNEVMLI